MGLNTTTLGMSGSVCIASSSTNSDSPAEDAAHICTRTFDVQVYAPGIGAAASRVFVTKAQTDITITGISLVSSMALATDANNPDITLATSDQAAATLVAVTDAIGLDTALAIGTARTAAIISAALAAITAGQSLYLSVTTNGQAAIITELATLTVTISYILTS
jgi:hypothetical protein